MMYLIAKLVRTCVLLYFDSCRVRGGGFKPRVSSPILTFGCRCHSQYQISYLRYLQSSNVIDFQHRGKGGIRTACRSCRNPDIHLFKDGWCSGSTVDVCAMSAGTATTVCLPDFHRESFACSKLLDVDPSQGAGRSCWCR
jgi:hypothetical protein